MFKIYIYFFFINFTLLSNLKSLFFFNIDQNLPCTSEKHDDAKITAVQVDAKKCTDLPQHTTSNLLSKVFDKYVCNCKG